MSQNLRDKFEAWLWDVHYLTATWNTSRNCYDEFPAHLAFKAWQQAAQAPAAEPRGEYICKRCGIRQDAPSDGAIPF